jgi:hypothetical protein
MKQGSYTVEAALLFGILLPLLTGLIFLGIHRKIQGEILAEAVEQAVIQGMQGEAEGENGEKEISISINREVPGAPFGNHFFQLQSKVRGEWSVKKDHPEKTVFRLHSLKKLIRQVSE